MGGSQAEAGRPRWKASGKAAAAPLPGALASARDRPWPIVGREPELEAIASAWTRVVAGGREAVLIAGEPGAGKSRLVAEAGHAARGAGALVLYGSGENTGDTPLAPFAAAFGHLGRHASGALLEELHGTALGDLMPEVDAAGDSPWGLGDERVKLFAAATGLLERIGADRPVLLAIDDLHACGSSTLELVRHLACATAPLRLLLLATYRPTDVDPEGSGAAAIADLRSGPGAQHLRLGGLDAPALREIAAALELSESGERLDRAAEDAARESGGNALFACELLRAMSEAGATPEPEAPPSLQMLIAARARALGERAYEHLCAAAVCGPEFDRALVAAATEAEPAELAVSLERAERAGLVATETGGACSFTHSVVARCLYSETGLARRGAWHRTIAERLEREAGGSGARSGELARHWLRADPPDEERAARWCAAAGADALGRYDHGAAASWFEQALAGRSGKRESEGGERCDLLIGLGEALRFSNQERSRECLLEAARLADRLDDAERLVRAALANHRGFVSHVGGFDRERGAMLRRAAERLGEPGPEQALVLAQLALELTFSAQVERRRRLADRALAMARDSGDPRVVSQVLIRCLIARWGPENPDERIALAAESIEIGARLDEPLDLFHALHWQGVAQVEIGEIGAAARTLREQESIAGRVGDATARWLTECAEALHLSLRGRLDEAEERAQSAVESAKRSAQPDALPFYISQIASIRWQQGRLGELAPLLARALDQYPGIPAFRSLVTLANALAGESAFAREVLAGDVATGFAELPRDPIWLGAAATYAHAIAELGDAAAAERLRPLLEPYRGRLATTTISIWGMVDHALGRLEALLGEEDGGERSLRAAIDAYAAMPAPLWQAQAEAHLPAEGRRASALELKIGALGLTARQSEVIGLIAQGRTNGEVAAELHISPSTVKRHLEDAYERTGVRSRAALTALLLE